jgi:hypothetical protein
LGTYEHTPPFGQLALAASVLFGTVSSLTTRGIDVLEAWLERQPELKARLIVMVYPACATRQADLSRLLQLAERASDRLLARICPLERIIDRGTNALCFVQRVSDAVHVATGPSENFGLEPTQNGQVNFVFRADPSMVEAFKRYFDWLWASSREIAAQGAALIPDLVFPEGSLEGARLWRAYMDGPSEGAPEVAQVNPDTGDVTLMSAGGEEVLAPTEELGVKKLDPLAERVARLYEHGALVSIDKLSRIPPLDAPLDPRFFGDASELHRGNVTREVKMRVSVIDQKTLKEIEKRREKLRVLLPKFTFSLADNMRWMPVGAKTLFESELKRINEEGQQLISDLLKGDVDAFIKGKHDSLVADIDGMYAQLGRPGKVTANVIAAAEESLKERLEKAQAANFMPKLSYSTVTFAATDNALASPWGQAYSLLSDIAAFPRKALTDSFFFRGLKVSKKVLIKAMNVADDALLRNLVTFDIEARCKDELDLLARIEKAPIESKARCEFVGQILDGSPFESIDKELKKKEAT